VTADHRPLEPALADTLKQLWATAPRAASRILATWLEDAELAATMLRQVSPACRIARRKRRTVE
jgi:hypothetical protein